MPDLTPPSFVRLRFTRPPRPDSLLIAGDVGRFPPADADRYLADGCAVEEPERTGYDLAALDAYRRTPWRGRRMLGGARRWLDVVLGSLLVLAVLSMPGCPPKGNGPTIDTTNLPAASQDARTISDRLDSSVRVVRLRADAVDAVPASRPKETAAVIAPAIRVHTDAIRAESVVISEQARAVDPGLVTRIERAEADMETLQVALADMTQQRDDETARAEKEKKRADSWISKAFFGASILCFIVGAGLIVWGVWPTVSFARIGIGIGAIVFMGVFLGLAMWWREFAIGALVVAGLALVGLIVALVLRSKGLFEVSQLAEHVKGKLSAPVRADVFGGATDPGKTPDFLSDATARLVDTVRDDPAFRKAPPVAPAPAATGPVPVTPAGGGVVT